MDLFPLGDYAARVVEQGHPYVRGPVHPNTKSHATSEYKAGSPDHSGGGYPRWRSTEFREHTSRFRGREDVFVPVHRLLAVVACYDADEPLADVLAHLDGRDVHHQLEMPSANLPDEIEVRGHAEHSSLTQRQRTTYAKLTKQRVEREERGETRGGECAASGCRDDVAASVAGAEWFIEHAAEQGKRTGETVELH